MSRTHSAYQRTLSKRDFHARKRRCAVQCCNRPARPLQRYSGSTDRAAIALSRRCSLRSASPTEPSRVGFTIVAASIAFVAALTLALSELAPPTQAEQSDASTIGQLKHREGQAIFRFDTFGDEQLWTDTLRMHEVIPKVDPATALAVG